MQQVLRGVVLKKVVIAALIFIVIAAAFIVTARDNGITVTKTYPLKGWKQIGTMPEATLDALRGWTNSTIPRPSKEPPAPSLPKAIEDDYQDFVRKLPVVKDHFGFGDHSERYWIQWAWAFEDKTGQKAIVIFIPLEGTFVHYILIYDQNNKRTKTIKYLAGHYSS
jgi:hypothetical protein